MNAKTKLAFAMSRVAREFPPEDWQERTFGPEAQRRANMKIVRMTEERANVLVHDLTVILSDTS